MWQLAVLHGIVVEALNIFRIGVHLSDPVGALRDYHRSAPGLSVLRISVLLDPTKPS
jgi:hypothetical protein